MTVREIFRIIPSGLRVAIQSWIAMRWGYRHAKKGIRIFQNTLHQKGLPPEAIQELVRTYRATADLLSIRNLSSFALRGMHSQSD